MKTTILSACLLALATTIAAAFASRAKWGQSVRSATSRQGTWTMNRTAA